MPSFVLSLASSGSFVSPEGAPLRTPSPSPLFHAKIKMWLYGFRRTESFLECRLLHVSTYGIR